MKNDLTSLNDYLFEQLERLNDDEQIETSEKFEKEVNRSKAITDVAKTIIDNAKIILDAQKFVSEDGRIKELPKILLTTNEKTNKK
jgi:hypothetical protein